MLSKAMDDMEYPVFEEPLWPIRDYITGTGDDTEVISPM